MGAKGGARARDGGSRSGVRTTTREKVHVVVRRPSRERRFLSGAVARLVAWGRMGRVPQNPLAKRRRGPGGGGGTVPCGAAMVLIRTREARVDKVATAASLEHRRWECAEERESPVKRLTDLTVSTMATQRRWPHDGAMTKRWQHKGDERQTNDGSAEGGSVDRSP